ncbi:MAG: hypothetical protein KF819_09845 [Labilithrix sp.]|nr:hypothetical protein [Labilithrix sp.]
MRNSLFLLLALSAAVPVAACGSEGAGDGAPPLPGDDPNGDGSGFGSSGGGANGSAQDLEVGSMRIEPPDAVLTVTAGSTVTQAYKVFAKVKGAANESDVTSRVVFYVPDNYLVGGFPLDGGSLFTSRLPATANDPPQRGGKLTVEATASNAAGPVKVTTSLTVKLTAILESPNGAVPANPASKFGGAVDAARKPVIVYPNDGVMLPPNLRRLDVHWRRGNASNELFEVRFTSAAADIAYYSRCGSGAGLNGADACAFELDGAGYGYLAESNRGAGPVTLRIRATDDAGTSVGESTTQTLELAESRVDGGLYYWAITGGSGKIMRFDFGAATGLPQEYLTATTAGSACPGCHTLSRDGKKLVASQGGQNDGRLIYQNNVGMPIASASDLTVGSSTAQTHGENRIQFAAFNPTGSQFVAVYGDRGVGNGGNLHASTHVPASWNTDAEMNTLFFHDGTTGLRVGSKALTFKPNHPDWSPDGKMIAVSRVGNTNTTTQMPTRTSLELLTAGAGGTFADPVTLVAAESGIARFNPNFVPDSSFLYFTEAICPGGNWDSGDCNADADPSAKTWAMKPQPGSKRILLARASAAGVADNAATDLGDTFPRSAPFQTKHKGGKLFWFTVASRRQAGLRTVGGAQHLWMFAVDPAKIMAGDDGSYPGFYLPFQDLTTSNHIGQWTEKIVGGTQPPPPAPPPPPPPPPAPPAPK